MVRCRQRSIQVFDYVVHMLNSDTDNGGHDTGAYGSAGTVVAGRATQLACEALREQILSFAGEHGGGTKAAWSLVAGAVVRAWQVLPGGADLPIDAVTVDIYPSWDAVFTGRSHVKEHFQKAHPDMEFGTTMERIDNVRTIVSRNLFTVADMAGPPPSTFVIWADCARDRALLW